MRIAPQMRGASELYLEHLDIIRGLGLYFMKGLYLYCVRPRIIINSLQGKAQTNSKLSKRGINGSKIWTLPYCNLEVVVSLVSLDKFGSEMIQRKAREDLKWIKEKAQAHEAVIEKAMRGEDGKVIPVIPMKFGTIFETKEKLEQTLKRYYNQFEETLKKIKGKQEWSVKAYLDYKVLEKEVKKKNPIIQERERKIAHFPEGMAYFMRKQTEDIVSKEVDTALQKLTENFFGSLKKYAAAGVKGKILEKELTGKSLHMVLNAIFLVKENKAEDFIKGTNKLKREYKSKGFNFEPSGPWPTYNYI